MVDGLQCILGRNGVDHCLHCLDDFLILGNGSQMNAVWHFSVFFMHLTRYDIAVDDTRSPSIMRVSTKQSKTDQRGVNLFMGRTSTELCPVSALLNLTYFVLMTYNLCVVAMLII